MIDWDRVAELRDEVGAEDFDEVVELFLQEVEEVTGRLDAAPEPSRLAQDLHFLKGSALNLGFRQFSSLCQSGETLSEAGQWDAVDLGEILLSYRQSKSSFLSALPQAFS